MFLSIRTLNQSFLRKFSTIALPGFCSRSANSGAFFVHSRVGKAGGSSTVLWGSNRQLREGLVGKKVVHFEKKLRKLNFYFTLNENFFNVYCLFFSAMNKRKSAIIDALYARANTICDAHLRVSTQEVPKMFR